MDDFLDDNSQSLEGITFVDFDVPLIPVHHMPHERQVPFSSHTVSPQPIDPVPHSPHRYNYMNDFFYLDENFHFHESVQEQDSLQKQQEPAVHKLKQELSQHQKQEPSVHDSSQHQKHELSQHQKHCKQEPSKQQTNCQSMTVTNSVAHESPPQPENNGNDNDEDETNKHLSNSVVSLLSREPNSPRSMMDVLIASAELESPKKRNRKSGQTSSDANSAESLAKKNAIYFVIFKNDLLTVQFCSNFHALQMSNQLVLSLKLGFQQKIFLHTLANITLRIVLQESNGTLCALNKLVDLPLNIALVSFSVRDKQEFRDNSFDLRFYQVNKKQDKQDKQKKQDKEEKHNNQDKQDKLNKHNQHDKEDVLIGEVRHIFLHAQYAFNTLKKRAHHGLDYDGSGNCSPKKRKSNK